MIRTRSLQWLWVGVVVCFVIGVVVLLIISGTFTASGEIWDVNRASDLDIGTDQQQVISNIEVLNSNQPIKIHIGDIVESGAELDHNATSYWVDTEEQTNSSEVYVQNPNSSNATIIVPASAISSPGLFDVYIDNIDTTNISKYNEKGVKTNDTISYTAKQGQTEAPVEFRILSPGSIEFKRGTYNESTQSVFYDLSINDSLNLNTAVTLWQKKQNGNIGKKIKTVDISSDSISLKGTDIEHETELIIGLHSPPDTHGSDTIYALDSTTVNVSVPARVVSGPYYYSQSSTDTEPGRTLLFEFNTNISDSQGYISTNFSANNSTTIQLENQSEAYDVDGKYLYVYPLHAGNITNQEIQPEIKRIKAGNITSTSSPIPFNNQFSPPVRVDKIISNGGKHTINQGSNVGVQLVPHHNYNISKLNGDLTKKIGHTGSNYIHKVSTDNLSLGYYSLNSDSGIKNTTIQLLDSSIHVETANTVNGSQIPIIIDANGTNRTAIVSVSKSSTQKIYQNRILLNNKSTMKRHVSVSQLGTYSVEVHDLSTNHTTTQAVKVIEDRNPTVNTGSSGKLSNGGRLTLILNSTYGHSSVYLKSSKNTTITLELTTTETGPTPVRINTYASPESPSEFVTTGTGVSVESVTGDVDSLRPGTYDLTLSSEHGTEVANDTATVTLKPRSTNDLTAYTTRAVAPDGFENATAVRGAIADGTLTRATAATANDTVVYAVNATGLTGLPATANESLERGADLDRLDGLAFGVAPAETDDGNESSGGDALGRTPDEAAVHLDRDGLYLVVAGDRAFGTETLPDPGETFEAAFRVDDGRLRRTAAQDRHRVSTGLTYVADPTGEKAGTASVDGSTEVTVSAESGPSDSSGPSVASSASDGPAGGGSHGGSSSGTASTGGPSGPGSAAGPTGPDDAGNATGMGGLGGSDGPLGSDGGRSTPPPGVGVSIPPGTSEIPPSARPATLSGTGGPERDADGSAASESRSENGRANDGGSDENGDATAVDSADSTESSEPSAAGKRPSNGADATDLDYDEAPIRSTAYDLPGFGAVASLAALTGASLLARRCGRKP
jgi:PGF-CTERM protein